MRDFIGLMFLILAGALATKYFAFAIPPFLVAMWLMAGKGSSPTSDDAVAILGGIGMLCAIATIIYAVVS